jgi:hypothetical protein
MLDHELEKSEPLLEKQGGQSTKEESAGFVSPLPQEEVLSVTFFWEKTKTRNLLFP